MPSIIRPTSPPNGLLILSGKMVTDNTLGGFGKRLRIGDIVSVQLIPARPNRVKVRQPTSRHLVEVDRTDVEILDWDPYWKGQTNWRPQDG